MQMTGTNRGTNATNTSGQNTLVITPGSNCTAGALLVLVIAYDNSGTGGVDPYSAISDSVGNTWTSRLNVLKNGGAANSGCVLRIFTCPQNVAALTTSNTITVSFGGITTVARAWTLQEFTSSNGTPTYVSGSGATFTTSTPTITTSSVGTGNAVICGLSVENGTAITITADSDSTNGVWSTQQTSKIGIGNAGINVASQFKVISGTGTQTYNPTINAGTNLCIGWISIIEPSNLTITVPLTTLALTEYAPQVNTTIIPSKIDLTTNLFAPQVKYNTIVTPPKTDLTLTTFAPTVVSGGGPITIDVPKTDLIITKYAPTLNSNLIIPKKSVILTEYPPTLNSTTIIPSSSLSTTEYAPTIIYNTIITPPQADLTLNRYAPTLNSMIPVPKANLFTNTFAPTVEADKTVIIPVQSLTLTTFNPTLNSKIDIPTRSDVITSYPPSLPITLTVPTDSLIINTFEPTLINTKLIIVDTLDLTLTLFNPQVNQEIIPSTESLILTTFPINLPLVATPDPINLSITTDSPTIDLTTIVPTIPLIITTYPPQSIGQLVQIGYDVYLKEPANVTHLNCSGHNLDGQLFISQLINLIYLDVSNNNFDTPAIDAIVQALIDNGLHDGYLDIRGNAPTTLDTTQLTGWTVLQ
jgi:hypothetical protein